MPGPAADVVVPVTVTPAADVASLTASLTYDDAVLEATAVYRTAATADWTLSADLSAPGTIDFQLAAGTPLTVAGPQEAVWIVFQVVGPAPSTALLEWTAVELNGGDIPATPQNGQVSVVAASRVIAVPDDLQGQPGTPVLVPVTATDVAGAESFDVILRYDPTVLDATSVAKTPLTQPMTLTTFLGIAGEVRISLFSIQALPPGSGAIVQITFDTVGSFGQATPLDLTKGVINESAISTSLDDGLLVLCDPEDGDFDGFSGCAGDCGNTDPEINPGATEVCNGTDDDCDGSTDEGIAAPEGEIELTLDRFGADVEVAWTAVDEADGYDVVRGGLAALRRSGGDFTGAVDECIADDLATTSVTDASVPEASVWYLVRPVNCGGAGSFDSASPQQLDGRDDEIEAAPAACP